MWMCVDIPPGKAGKGVGKLGQEGRKPSRVMVSGKIPALVLTGNGLRNVKYISDCVLALMQGSWAFIAQLQSVIG